MKGNRKIWLTGMGLAALLLLGAMCTYGGLPTDALDTLSWAVVFTVCGGVTGNAAEHYAARAPAAQVHVSSPAAQAAPPATASTTVAVVNT